MHARIILSVVATCLILAGVGCGQRRGGSPSKTGAWASGKIGGASIFIRTLDRDVQYFVIFDARYLGLESNNGTIGQLGATPVPQQLTFSPNHLTVPFLHASNGESLQVGPTTYSLSKGRVFLCKVRQGTLNVEQVTIDLSGIDAQDPTARPATHPYPNAALAASNLAKRDVRVKDFIEAASKAASMPAPPSTSKPAGSAG